jgi:putative copper export protein
MMQPLDRPLQNGERKMDMVIALVFRWIHIISATALVGGLIFLRYVVVPVGEKSLTDDVYKDVHTKLAQRFQIVSHACLLLFLVSGFYNYIFVTSPMHDGQGIYHMLFGIKFTFAIAAFVIVILVTSKRARGEKLRANGRRWYVIALALAVVTVMLGGVMKNFPAPDEGERRSRGRSRPRPNNSLRLGGNPPACRDPGPS